MCVFDLTERQERFCARYKSTCGTSSKSRREAHELGAAYTDCLAQVAEMPSGSPGAPNGDSFACR